MTPTVGNQNKTYLDILVRKIRVCRAYKPKFGQGKQVTLDEFLRLYGDDPLYSWLGLDNPLLYATHKAAGGMTSLYRQVGTGLETVFRQILRDQLGLSAAQSAWSYSVPVPGKQKTKKLTLDGRIVLDEVADKKRAAIVQGWLLSAAKKIGVDPKVAASLKGMVFEVRQGYKSKDSKRQQGDIANAGTAYSQGYLPVALILSNQIDADVAARYAAEKWVLLRGVDVDDDKTSTFAFLAKVLGYDLAALLKENTHTLKEEVDEVLRTLLTPDAGPPAGTSPELEDIDETESLEPDGSNDDVESVE